MADRDKLIFGLKCCDGHIEGYGCYNCPYKNDGEYDSFKCAGFLAHDALEILEDGNKMATPVEPIRDSWLNWRCGNCRREIDKYEGDVYCPGCGRKVKWE